MTTDLHNALEMWGRWARQDSNPGGYQLSRLWVEWIPSQWWRDIGEEPPPAIESREAEPDEQACIALDREITALSAIHARLLVIRYVQQRTDIDPLRIGEAERALQDRL